jgi:hypothetical protein
LAGVVRVSVYGWLFMMARYRVFPIAAVTLLATAFSRMVVMAELKIGTARRDKTVPIAITTMSSTKVSPAELLRQYCVGRAISFVQKSVLKLTSEYLLR